MPTPTATATAPASWPVICAEVTATGATIDINGSRTTFDVLGVEAGRTAVVAQLSEKAVQLRRPVEVTSKDPTGTFRLRVHPNGSVEEVAPPAPTPEPATYPVARQTPAAAPAPAAASAAATARQNPSVRPVAPAPVVSSRSPRRQPAQQQPAAVRTPPKQEPRASLPTLADLQRARPTPKAAPATWGARGAVVNLTGGLCKPVPGRAEAAHRHAVERIRRSTDGPRTIVVVNPKGGTGKTTSALSIAAALGQYRRGGSVLAWDNNETRGTLGWRAQHSLSHTTAVDLLHDRSRFGDVASRFGDLDNYVRSQGDAGFDVLASHEDARATAAIDADGFGALHALLSRYYRLMVIDTGNNWLAPNWQAAVASADQLVIVTPIRQDAADTAAWLIDALRDSGNQAKVAHAVTVLQDPGMRVDKKLRQELVRHFQALTRQVLQVPYEPSHVPGKPVVYDERSHATQQAWVQVVAGVVDGL